MKRILFAIVSVLIFAMGADAQLYHGAKKLRHLKEIGSASKQTAQDSLIIRSPGTRFVNGVKIQANIEINTSISTSWKTYDADGDSGISKPSGFNLTNSAVAGIVAFQVKDGESSFNLFSVDTLGNGIFGNDLDVVVDLTAGTIASDGSLSGMTITGTGLISTTVTTEQLRLNFDVNNYATHTVVADGAYTITTVDASAAEGDINLAPDGFVGILTAVPTVELDVTGSILASVDITATNDVIGDSLIGTTGIRTGGDITVGDDVLLADGAVVGITGNEVITFLAAGSINVTGATMDVDGAFTAATLGVDNIISPAISGAGNLLTIDTDEQLSFEFNTDNNEATAFRFLPVGANIELVASSGEQAFVKIFVRADQTGTANYAALVVDVVEEDGTASGQDLFFDFRLISQSYFRQETDGDMFIGGALAGKDIVQTWDGETNDGTITYMEDEDRFDFDNDVDVIGDITGATIVSDGILTALGAFTSLGIDDNADANAITISSGEIVTFTQAPVFAGYTHHLDINVGAAVVGSTAPTATTVGTARGLGFDADAEVAHFEAEIPSDWDGASDFTLVVHWFPTSGDAVANTETVKWDATLRSIATGEAVDNGTVALATATFTGGGSETDKESYETSITIAYTGGNQPLTKLDKLFVQFDRDVTADTYSGAGIVTSWELVYTSVALPQH